MNFWLTGIVYKQNCRIWRNTNLEEMLQVPLQSENCTVCILVIRPYFFKNEAEVAVTVTAENYRTMIVQYFFQNLNDINLEEMRMQPDGVACYTLYEIIDLSQTIVSDKRACQLAT